MTQDTSIVDQFGPIVRQEFDRADEWYQPGIVKWLGTLTELTDAELQAQSEYWIYESASVNRFRGNWDHIHVKATACFNEAERRLVQAGHGKDCHAPSIYSRAHAAVMRSQRHEPSPEGTCTCDLEGRP